MKIRKELGSDAVRDIIERARLRARELPDRSLRDPWPSSYRRISEVVEPEDDATPETKK